MFQRIFGSAQKPKKRFMYACSSGNQWSVWFEVGDRKTQRRCFCCKQPCSPAAIAHIAQSKRGLPHR